MPPLSLKKFNVNNRILTYCRIKNQQVWLNGQLFYQDKEASDPSTFLSNLYKYLELTYPKFFKMDKLCKLGTLASELVFRNTVELSQVPKSETALVFSNSASSLDTDRIHQQSISNRENYFPSPSVFVYTLPNILLGEIAIKHKVTGENSFFISETFNPHLLRSYTDLLLQNTPTVAVVCGWVNVDGNAMDAFVYCVKNSNFNGTNMGSDLLHTAESLDQLYTT